MTVKTLGKSYSEQIEPLVQKYCHGCHGLKRIEAEINLAAFKGLMTSKSTRGTWQKVAEMLDSGQMPPGGGESTE